jgi:hypothetical protein
LQKHLRKDHRDEHAARHQEPTYNQLSKFPEDLDPVDIKILSLYFKTVPAGYDPIDKPMMGCKIRVDGVWQERHYYDFIDVQERFVSQLAEFFVEKTEFVKPERDILTNADSDSGYMVSVDDEWMRSA